MFEWFRKRKRKAADAPSHGRALHEAAGASADSIATLGPLVDDMRAKGYQGPFGGSIDGINVLIFHAPGVNPVPTWLNREENPFHMRVVDCRSICGQSLLYAYGDGASVIQAALDRATEADETQLRDRISTEPDRRVCAFGYPLGSAGRPPDGPQVLTAQMEDLWNIFLFDNTLYFTNSWTGRVRHRARLCFSEHAMFITAIETFAADVSEDDTFSLREVDYLVKAALYKVQTPAPVPATVSSDAGDVAAFALTRYGRLAGYVSPDDTTHHRLCLNGMLKTIVPNTDNSSILVALKALQNQDVNLTREQGLESLRELGLLFALQILDPEQGAAAITRDTKVGVVQHSWHGETCFFAYSDPAYCVEQSDLHVSICGNGLAGFVRQWNEKAGLVINPGGPATVVLRMAELETIATEA